MNEGCRNEKGQFIKGCKLGKMNEKHRQNIINSWTKDRRKKFSEMIKGKLSPMKGKHHTQEAIDKIRLSSIGRVKSKEACEKISNSKIGKKREEFSKEWKEKMGARGDRNRNWKGGISTTNNLIRTSAKFRDWRESVFKKDNYTCAKYGTIGGKIVAHHIFSFADNPIFRTVIENGITLSQKAHIEFHKLYGTNNNNLGQLKEFINYN